MQGWTSSDWLAAGGLGVAALALLLAYLDRRHARAESYRAALYTAQLDATRELLRAVGQFLRLAYASTRAGPDFSRLVQDELGPAVNAVDVAHRAGAAVLPEGISDAVDVHVRSVLEAVFPNATPDLTPEERHDRIEAAWVALGAVVQRKLGVTPLSRQVQKLTGVTALEQLERATELYQERLDGSREPRDYPPQR